MPNPQQELIKTIINEARDAKAFGGGQASNVVRFFIREKSKGGGGLYVQSRAAAATSRFEALTGRHTSKREYAFYARMNMNSARSFDSVLDFCRRVISFMSSKEENKIQKSLSKVLIPRVLMSVNRGEAGYDVLRTWIRKMHEEGRKDYRKDYRMGFDDFPTPEQAEGAPRFSSISIVEGSWAVGLIDSMVYDGMEVPSFEAHAKALGHLHALDVALGMGDRLQNPNPANITENPQTRQLVLIDIDTFLPPKNLGADIENACVARSDYYMLNRKLKNESWAKWQEDWPACPPRAPFQGNYMQGVAAALDHDYNHYLDHLDGNYISIMNKGKYHDKMVRPLAGAILKQYLSSMRSVHIRAAFRAATISTMREIRRGVNSGEFRLDVEDETCSALRLRERVNQWMF